jgi:heme/copper-type cytochrome/quinol oxidase subunit 2
MRLSDIMGNMGLADYPTVALVIFLGVFAAVAVRAWRMTRRERDRCASMPLED